MRAFVQVVIIGMVTVVLVVGGVFFWVIPRDDVWKVVLERVLAPYEISVESVSFEQLRYQKYPRSFVKNIQIQFRRENVLWKIHIAQAQIQWKKEQGPVFFVNDLTLHSQECHCEKGYLRFEAEDNGVWQFQWDVGQCRYAGMTVTDFLVNAQLNRDGVVVPDFRGHFYGGQFAGRFTRNNQKPFAYSLNMRFDDVDLGGMNAINPAVFGQVSGVLQGNILIRGEDSQLSYVNGNFDIPRQGAIRAFLLKNLMDYLPAGSQKVEFSKLVATNGMVPLEIAKIQILSVDAQNLSLSLDLESRKYNIKPQITFDIHFDGRYQEFLTLGQSYFSKENSNVQ